MADTDDNHESTSDQQSTGETATSRRTLLRLGAIAVPAAVTMKPSLAAASSVMNCTIPVPGAPEDIGKWVKRDGSLTAPQSKDAYPGAVYSGEQVLTGRKPAGVSQPAFRAHMEYIQQLQRGTPGFTCFASIAGRRIL